MYKIVCITDSSDSTEYPLYNTNDTTGQLMVSDPTLTLEVGRAGELTFTIPPTHPYKDKIKTMVSEILVYQDGIDEPIFAGRHVGDERDFYNQGKVTVEGELAYLNDSVQRPYSFSGEATAFLEELLEVHNGQVEDRKQFTVGKVNVPDLEADEDRSLDTADSTMNVVKSKLTDLSGGNLRVRRENGVKYLDYLETYGNDNTQPVRFAYNLADITRTNDPTEMFTALIPYGNELDDDEDDEEDTDLNNRLTIADVNGGKDYIINEEAVATYGYIWATETFDCDDASQLLKKAKKHLEESCSVEVTIEATALDMSIVDGDVSALEIGCYTNIYDPQGNTERMLLNKKVLYLDQPEKNTMTFGKVSNTFTGSTNDNQFEIGLKVASISGNLKTLMNQKIDNATNLITGGYGGYVMIHLSESDGHPDEIVIMDTNSVDTCTNCIRFNKNGIGFSNTGYNGTFKNAWTIDGNLVADFITAGTLSGDRVKGGTLEIGGTSYAADGQLIVYDSSNNKIVTMNANGVSIKGTIYATSGSIGGFGISNNNLYSDAENASIEWGDDYYMDGNGACIGGWQITDDGLYGPLLEGNGYAQYWDEDGNIHCTELYVANGWWKDWSLTDTIETLWDYVYNGGWNQCTYDCDDWDCEIDCDSECDEHTCGEGAVCGSDCDSSGGPGAGGGCSYDGCDGGTVCASGG